MISHFLLMVRLRAAGERLLRGALAPRPARAVEARPAALPRHGGRRSGGGLADVPVPVRAAGADPMTDPRRGHRLLVVAGEASGDLHGARLLTELRRLVPGVEAFGLGGDELRAAGLETLADSSEVSVVGLDRGAQGAAAGPPALRRPAGGGRPPAAGGGGAGRLRRVQPPPRPRAEEAGRAGALLHQSAGLGLAAGAGADHRRGRRPDDGALPVRGRLLPPPRRRGDLGRPSAGGRSPRAAPRLGRGASPAVDLAGRAVPDRPPAGLADGARSRRCCRRCWRRRRRSPRSCRSSSA